MMTAVLPLISPEKGMQLGFVAQGILLVVSGVYYPISVLPEWMQVNREDLAGDIRARRGVRESILHGKGLTQLWGDIWPLLVIGVVAVPLGLRVFRRGEQHAKATASSSARDERGGPSALGGPVRGGAR